MDKDTRSAIQAATQRARQLLEDDFASQLEGDFDVQRSGAVAERPGPHLLARQVIQRDRIIAAIEHKRAAGLAAADAVADYLRDAAFTTLNRFVALKMLEARELVQECVTKGEESAGYREFHGLAPELRLPDSAGYRLYVESLFDELSTEVKVLFDRRDPASVLWPKRTTFQQLLEILNATNLTGVWSQDETIGWVYQYFNGSDERRRMREESPAPRNSRELAVRNQFFTPRYVVQFLTDNTLGRIWYEMRGTQTVLAERCEYMVHKPDETFSPQAKKDPRDIRVLDPACGSGHFLLYAFDLFLTIYEEAHADPDAPRSEVTGRTLAEDFPSLEALRRAMPGLILAHNLHGVDIDARCAQIAQLALWMRSQRTYRDCEVPRADRPLIRRSNIVIAEPLVIDEQIAHDFVARLGDVDLERAFLQLVKALKLAGDLGILLRLESLLTPEVAKNEMGDIFAQPAERIRTALERFVAEERDRANIRKRLFAEDAEQGIGLLEVAEKEFDVVLMNPPFGEPTKAGKNASNRHLASCDDDLGAAFIHAAATRWARGGTTGVVSSSTLWFKHTLAGWRQSVLLGDEATITLGAHLGGHVLDNASVGAAATVLRPAPSISNALFFRCLRAENKAALLLESIRNWRLGVEGPPTFSVSIEALRAYRKSPLVYWISPALRSNLTRFPALEGTGAEVRQGVACADDPRFVRAWWELPVDRVGAGKDWLPFAKSSEYSPFWDDITWIIRWSRDGAEVRAYDNARPQNTQYFGRSGVTFPARAVLGFNPRAFPSGIGFGHMGSVAFPKDTAASTLLGYLSSRPAEYVLSFSNGSLQGRKGAYQNHYEVGQIGDLPWPNFASGITDRIGELGNTISRAAMLLLRNDETTHQHRPFRALRSSVTLDEYIAAELAEDDRLVSAVQSARSSLDALISAALGFKGEDIEAMNEEFAECDTPTDGPWCPARPTLNSDLREHTARALVSLAVGLTLGRFDPRRFMEDAPEPPYPSPLESFDPASLTLRARQSGVGSPIALSPSGMIVIDRADPGLADRLLGEALARIWPTASPDALTQLSDILRVEHLSDYLSDAGASGFYADHTRRYSKGRRRAPLYFWFGTGSGSFGILLLAPAVTADTLFIMRNDIVAPRLARAEKAAEAARSRAGDGPPAATRDAIAAGDSLVAELRAFLAELDLSIPLWSPNIDDGVVVNAAPCYRLMPHREARTKAEATWKELCSGELNWAQLAMRFWPEHVIPKCATDRSLAIAHSLEEVFWEEHADGKWSPREEPTRELSDLIAERTSPAVKAALKSLLEAPVAAGNGGRGRKRRSATTV